MVMQVEKALEELGDKVDAGDKSAIDTELGKLKTLVEKYKNNANNMSEAETAELKNQTEALTKALQSMAEKLYQAGGPQGGMGGQGFEGGFGGAGAQGGPQQDDGTIDADFKEV